MQNASGQVKPPLLAMWALTVVAGRVQASSASPSRLQVPARAPGWRCLCRPKVGLVSLQARCGHSSACLMMLLPDCNTAISQATASCMVFGGELLPQPQPHSQLAALGFQLPAPAQRCLHLASCGLVAGDWAELELDSRLGAGSVNGKIENQTLVWLSYLRSYEVRGSSCCRCRVGLAEVAAT